jgi:AcrR family transcriptional regulator
MSILTRKQQEIARREEDILDRSRAILLDEGYKDLTIDRLASDLAVSKGTIYNHFANKEDIVLALATKALQTRLALFATVSTYAAETRLRLLAIGAAAEHFCDHYHDLFRVEMWLRNNHIWEKSSGNFESVITQCEQSTVGLVSGIVTEAMATGELPEKDISPQEVVFGFWSLCHGGQILAATSPSLKKVGIDNVHQVIRRHCYYLVEAMKWNPLQSFQQHCATMDDYRKRMLSFRM